MHICDPNQALSHSNIQTDPYSSSHGNLFLCRLEMIQAVLFQGLRKHQLCYYSGLDAVACSLQIDVPAFYL